MCVCFFIIQSKWEFFVLIIFHLLFRMISFGCLYIWNIMNIAILDEAPNWVGILFVRVTVVWFVALALCYRLKYCNDRRPSAAAGHTENAISWDPFALSSLNSIRSGGCIYAFVLWDFKICHFSISFVFNSLVESTPRRKRVCLREHWHE